MHPLQTHYISCPLCRNIYHRNHIQLHYHQCKERMEQIKIQEELKKHTKPIFYSNQNMDSQQVLRYQMYLEKKRKDEEDRLKKLSQTSSSKITEIPIQKQQIQKQQIQKPVQR